MKNTLFVLIIIFAIFSCEKDERNSGNSSALKNGEIWEADHTTLQRARLLDNYFFIKSIVSGEAEGDSEHIYAYNLPYKVGKYTVHRITGDSLVGADYLKVIGGDQLVGGGAISEVTDTTNYIDISFYDECTNKIEGTFNLTFFGGLNYIDTIRFTNGRFEGKICERD